MSVHKWWHHKLWKIYNEAHCNKCCRYRAITLHLNFKQMEFVEWTINVFAEDKLLMTTAQWKGARCNRVYSKNNRCHLFNICSVSLPHHPLVFVSGTSNYIFNIESCQFLCLIIFPVRSSYKFLWCVSLWFMHPLHPVCSPCAAHHHNASEHLTQKKKTICIHGI